MGSNNQSNLNTVLISLGIIILLLLGASKLATSSQDGSVVELQSGEQLVDVVFKNSNLWILTKKVEPNHEPDTFLLHNFNGSDSYTIVERAQSSERVTNQ